MVTRNSELEYSQAYIDTGDTYVQDSLEDIYADYILAIVFPTSYDLAEWRERDLQWVAQTFSSDLWTIEDNILSRAQKEEVIRKAYYLKRYQATPASVKEFGRIIGFTPTWNITGNDVNYTITKEGAAFSTEQQAYIKKGLRILTPITLGIAQVNFITT